MSFRFRMPTLQEMRASPEGLNMIRIGDRDEFRNLLVTGCPGSGKTTLAVYRLTRLQRQGENVHLFTYHNMLAIALKHIAIANTVPPSNVSTFHRWFCPATHQPFNTDNPPTEEQFRASIESSSIPQSGITELLIDEGQDLPPCVFQVLPDYVARCYVGADDAQQVHPDHGTSVQQIADILRALGEPEHRHLDRNFRNTYETYRFARQFIPRTHEAAWDPHILDRLDRAKRHGDRPMVITYSDPVARDRHLQRVLRSAKGNVAILCPLGPVPPLDRGVPPLSVEEMYDIVTSMGIKATKYYNADHRVPRTLENYIVTTFKSAKGMEFDDVIIPRINFWFPIPAEWFVAATRALGRLYIYRDSRTNHVDPIAKFDPTTYEDVRLDSESPSDTQPF